MNHATLWKRILNEGLRQWPKPKVLPRDELVEAEIVRAPIIVAPPTEVNEASWLDLRGIAMPFGNFWIEGGFVGHPHHRWGCLMKSTNSDGGFRVKSVNCQSTHDLPPEIIGRIEFDLDRGGNPVQNTFVCDVPKDLVTTEFDEETIRSGIAYPALSAGLALMILGCKNVSLLENENDPKQVRRAIKRHGGTPESYRYHTLVVRPAGSSKHSAPTVEIGVMPRHVCRGHFAEYGPEFNKGLLFGRHAGRFYVPPCFKGKRERGVIEKDYIIEQ